MDNFFGTSKEREESSLLFTALECTEETGEFFESTVIWIFYLNCFGTHQSSSAKIENRNRKRFRRYYVSLYNSTK